MRIDETTQEACGIAYDVLEQNCRTGAPELDEAMKLLKRLHSDPSTFVRAYFHSGPWGGRVVRVNSNNPRLHVPLLHGKTPFVWREASLVNPNFRYAVYERMDSGTLPADPADFCAHVLFAYKGEG